MSTTKDKFKHLQQILNEYSLYLKNYDYMVATRINEDFFEVQYFKVVAEVEDIDQPWNPYRKEIPMTDLDIIIQKYKTKVQYEKHKNEQ